MVGKGGNEDSVATKTKTKTAATATMMNATMLQERNYPDSPTNSEYYQI